MRSNKMKIGCLGSIQHGEQGGFIGIYEILKKFVDRGLDDSCTFHHKISIRLSEMSGFIQSLVMVSWVS